MIWGEKKAKKNHTFGLVEGRTPDFSQPRTIIRKFVRSEHSTTELQAHDSRSPTVDKWQTKLWGKSKKIIKRICDCKLNEIDSCNFSALKMWIREE